MGEMELVWDAEVLEQLINAPTFIQKFIIKTTEEYARQHGHANVNLPMFNAVRSRYMKKRADGPPLDPAAVNGPGT